MILKMINVIDPECVPENPTNRYNAGWDIIAPYDIYLPHGCETMVDTGLIVKVESDHPVFTMLVPRSSSIKKELRIKNTVGIIDQSYCGPQDTIKIFFVRDEKRTHILQPCMPAKAMESNFYVGTMANVKIDGAMYAAKPEVVDIYEDPHLLFKKGDKIAQLIFLNQCEPDVIHTQLSANEWAFEWQVIVLKDVSELEDDSRGGFGSTGN